MKKRRIFLVALLIMSLIGMTACGSSGSSYYKESSDYAATDGLYNGEGYDDYGEYKTEEISDETASVSDNRKLIKTVDLAAETYEFQALVDTVENKVAVLGGYMESASIHTRYDNLQYGDFIIRVPVDKLDQFVNDVSEMSNITRREVNQDDVTLSYVDLESHKKALEAEQTSLLTLLENAVSIDDIITIQSRLTEVRYQLESMESKLRTMDNLIDYATIYLTVEEVETYTPVEEPSIGEKISGGFMSSLESVGNGFVNFFIFVVVYSPQLLVWGAVITIIVVVIRLIIKKSNAKAAKRMEERQKAMQAYGPQNGMPNMYPMMQPLPAMQPVAPPMQQRDIMAGTNTIQKEQENGQSNGQ